jgi:hypothetical protein
MKIDFSFNTKYGTFNDAIHLPDNHDLTEEQIESMKQERLNNWITIIETLSEEAQSETPPEVPLEEVLPEEVPFTE